MQRASQLAQHESPDTVRASYLGDVLNMQKCCIRQAMQNKVWKFRPLNSALRRAACSLGAAAQTHPPNPSRPSMQNTPLLWNASRKLGRMKTSNPHQTLCFHRKFTPQSARLLVPLRNIDKIHERKEPAQLARPNRPEPVVHRVVRHTPG